MTYEFACPQCQKVYEETFSIADCPRSIPCKICNAKAEKIISMGTTFHLGEGSWAHNRYSGDSNYNFPKNPTIKRPK